MFWPLVIPFSWNTCLAFHVWKWPRRFYPVAWISCLSWRCPWGCWRWTIWYVLFFGKLLLVSFAFHLCSFLTKMLRGEICCHLSGFTLHVIWSVWQILSFPEGVEFSIPQMAQQIPSSVKLIHEVRFFVFVNMFCLILRLVFWFFGERISIPSVQIFSYGLGSHTTLIPFLSRWCTKWRCTMFSVYFWLESTNHW